MVRVRVSEGARSLGHRVRVRVRVRVREANCRS